MRSTDAGIGSRRRRRMMCDGYLAAVLTDGHARGLPANNYLRDPNTLPSCRWDCSYEHDWRKIDWSQLRLEP